MSLKIKITRTGICFLLLVFLFYLFSFISQTGLLYIFMGVIVAAYVVSFIFGIRGVKLLKISDIGVIRTTEEESVDSVVQITNKSRKAIDFITIKTKWGILFKVKNLLGRAVRHVTPKIIFHTRGVYKFDSVEIETVYPFGLLSFSKRIQNRGEIIVYPKLYLCQAPIAAGFVPMLGGHYKGIHKTAFGDDFAGVRPYVEGDSLKFIHWKMTSKGQGIFVKEFNEEFSGKISIIIDLTDNVIADDNVVNWAVRAAGSLAFAALDIGHHVELIDFSGKYHYPATPFSDCTEILEFLAVLESCNKPFDLEKLEETTSCLPSKSSFVFVLTNIENEVVDYLNSISSKTRKISVYVPDVDELKNGCLKSLDDQIKVLFFEKSALCHTE